MGKLKKEKRFEVVVAQNLGLNGEVEVIVDKETGVNYLWRTKGYGGGLTALLDAEGKPVISEREQ